MKVGVLSVVRITAIVGLSVGTVPSCVTPIRSARTHPATSPRNGGERESPPGRNESETGSSSASIISRLTVNGDSIEAAEMWSGQREELTASVKTTKPDRRRAYVEQRAAQLITDKIAEMLLYQRASMRFNEEINTRIDKHVDDRIRRIVTTDHDGVQRRYEKHLESKGQTLREVRRKLRREVIVTSYLEQELKAKIAEPTRAELLALFRASAESLRRPERRSMSLIDVRLLDRLPHGVNEPGREEWESARSQARSRIQAAQLELQGGAAFGDVARKFSDGLHAADGGAWGWIGIGSVRERFEPAVKALYVMDTGTVSEIIETEDSFFLVRCDQADPTFEPKFESVQPQLKLRHFRVTYNRLIAELVTELRKQARIEPANLERFHAAVVQAAFDADAG